MVRMFSRAVDRLRVESSNASSYCASAFCSANVTSCSLAATTERSSSATTSPFLTTVPSGTIEEIFIWYAPACCALGGAVIWTSSRALSSPDVVTVTRNSPRFTRATTPASSRAGLPASSHAPGAATTRSAATRTERRRRKPDARRRLKRGRIEAPCPGRALRAAGSARLDTACRRWLQRYDEHHHDRHDEDEHAVILEVEIVDDPQERARRVAVGEPRQAQAHGRIHRQAEHAEHEADEQGGQTPLGIEPPVEDAEHEHRENRGSEIPLHALEIVIQPASSLDDGDPH